jgi:hypothetical protein
MTSRRTVVARDIGNRAGDEDEDEGEDEDSKMAAVRIRILEQARACSSPLTSGACESTKGLPSSRKA